MKALPVEERFRRGLSGSADAVGPWVVAVSGGLDSVVLLHLLRFGTSERRELVVAHFDHGMRPESAEDAQWVAGLAKGWGLDARLGTARVRPRSEAEARAARYRFLDEVREAVGAGLVVTAHHADDQAETVLFRALRGTGLAGLAGIPVRRGHYLRPLLGIWREELEAYAARQRLTWREDPTNRSLRYARNALRHRVIPDIETLVAPGARRALVRLAALAREDEAGWASVLPLLFRPLEIAESPRSVSVDRAALAALHPSVRARILRALAGRLGVTLDEATTRRSCEFTGTSGEGFALDLGGGLTLLRELDRVWIGPRIGRDAGHRDEPLVIPDPRPGSGEAWLAGRPLSVSWGGSGIGGALGVATFDPEALRFPLRVRAREAGDRIRLPGGTKKVKKLLLEARVPRTERSGVPLVVDACGDVLWIPGVARAAGGGGVPAERGLTIGIG